MDFPDLSSKDLLTLLLSSGAFVISVFTFYFNILRKPQVTVVPSDLTLTYEPNHVLRLHSNFTIFNSGALPGVLTELGGTIVSQNDSRQTTLQWLCFTQSINASEPDERVKPLLAFAGSVEPITVPGRSAAVKGIVLVSDQEWILRQGDYKVELTGTVAPGAKKLPHVGGSIRISEDNEEHLLSKCVRNADGVFESNVRLPFTIAKPGNTRGWRR